MPDRHPIANLQRWAWDHRGDLLGVSLVVVTAVLFLSPALKDGGTFGGFDYDTTLTSLGNGLYSVVHSTKNGDAVSQMISWNTLDWRAIHSGHFPLWNDYSGLGMPEFLNFESSVLSLPDLVSYAVPLRFAFLVVVFMKLVIAGTGTYAWCRALRLGPLAATFGGLTFMLAGAFSSWLTWPLSDVVAWVGWICCFGILAYRSHGRLRHIAGLALAVAFSIYGGFPEANIMVVLVLAVVVVVVGIVGIIQRVRPDVRGLGAVVGGGLLGIVLAAPLWFPGLQVIARSHRQSEGDYVGLPLKALPLIFSQGYFGLPYFGARAFELTKGNYYESVAYVGVIAVLLALFTFATSFRRPVVLALGVALFFTLAATYEPATFHPFESVVDRISTLSMVRFERMRVLSALLLAVLGAVGIDRLARRVNVRADWRAAAGSFVVVFALLVTIAAGSLLTRLAPGLARQHLLSLVVPFVSLGVAVALLGVALLRRRGVVPSVRVVRLALAGLVAVQAAVLFFAGVGIASYSHAFYPATPAEDRLTAIVGDGLVGLDGGNDSAAADVRQFTHIGFYPEVNIGYKVRVFTIHDPVLPAAYFTTWPDVAARPANPGGVALFVPDINTAALAWRYGVNFVLVGNGLTAPSGMSYVTTLAGERLYAVPGAARFSFSGGGDGRVRSVHGSATDGWTITTSASAPARLVLRVTATPGWHATIDGTPGTLTTTDGVLQALQVPAGTHSIRLWYLPNRLVAASVIAGSIGGAFIVVCGVLEVRRRFRRKRAIHLSA